jgi:hypothetical protein
MLLPRHLVKEMASKANIAIDSVLLLGSPAMHSPPRTEVGFVAAVTLRAIRDMGHFAPVSACHSGYPGVFCHVVRARLHRAPGKLGHVLARDRRVEVELPARPLRGDAHGRVWARTGGASFPCGSSRPPLTWRQRCTWTWRCRWISRTVSVRAISTGGRARRRRPPPHRLHRAPGRIRRRRYGARQVRGDDLKANQNVAKRVLRGGDRHLGLASRGVDKVFDFGGFHSALPQVGRAAAPKTGGGLTVAKF